VNEAAVLDLHVRIVNLERENEQLKAALQRAITRVDAEQRARLAAEESARRAWRVGMSVPARA
jgi:hypothetical protein